MSRLYTTGAVAKRTGLHVRTIQRWCRDGIVEHSRYPSGRLCFTADQVDALARRVEPIHELPEVRTPNPLFDPTRAEVVPIRQKSPAA